jgi:hypothetical protein
VYLYKLHGEADRRCFPHWFAQDTDGPSDSCVPRKPFARGLFITVMMQVVHTSETSVYSETMALYPRRLSSYSSREEREISQADSRSADVEIADVHVL